MLSPFVLAFGQEDIPNTVNTELNSHPVQPEIIKEVGIPFALREIARCESGGTQFTKDGEVIRGKVNPQDIGKYQINLKYHKATADKMGLDLFTEAGNEAYALYLYKTSGAKPWKASNPCHHLLG